MRHLSTFLFALPTYLMISVALSSAADQIDFARDVRPVFATHCYRCHGAKKQESSYRLDVRSAAMGSADFGDAPIVPGKASASPLYQVVAGTRDDDLVMPPEDEGERLTKDEVAILRNWIEQGANWPDALANEGAAKRTTDHWSFQPIKDVAPPTLEDPWIANGIDAFTLAKLRAAGLKPAKSADRAKLIRRLYLDMHGLLPPTDRVKAFVADRRADAYARLVDEVLASPRYGERWAQHWLDVVRYAETDGFEVNTPRPNAWPYRDYVIKALNDDKPYDQFVREQLAGDQVGADAATGFLVAAPALLPGQIGKDKDSMLVARQDELDEIIKGTGAALLGLTIGCARCHSHKFDPITQRDYYSLQAVFNGVRYGNRPLRTPMTQELKNKLKEIDARIADVQLKVQETRHPRTG